MRKHWDGVVIEWNSTEVEPGMRLHYGISGEGERTVVLVHGYPESCPDYEREE